jgi:hypothetical protein
MKNSNEQLELASCLRSSKSKIKNQKSKMARLWFARMRQIVDSAPDWPARPLQPPPIPARTIALNPPATDQQHLAE